MHLRPVVVRLTRRNQKLEKFNLVIFDKVDIDKNSRPFYINEAIVFVPFQSSRLFYEINSKISTEFGKSV